MISIQFSNHDTNIHKSVSYKPTRIAYYKCSSTYFKFMQIQKCILSISIRRIITAIKTYHKPTRIFQQFAKYNAYKQHDKESMNIKPSLSKSKKQIARSHLH